MTYQNRPIPTEPSKLVSYLCVAEVDGDRQPDARMVLMDERVRLQAAINSHDPRKIAAARDEALRVAKMWQSDPTR